MCIIEFSFKFPPTGVHTFKLLARNKVKCSVGRGECGVIINFFCRRLLKRKRVGDIVHKNGRSDISSFEGSRVSKGFKIIVRIRYKRSVFAF